MLWAISEIAGNSIFISKQNSVNDCFNDTEITNSKSDFQNQSFSQNTIQSYIDFIPTCWEMMAGK